MKVDEDLRVPGTTTDLSIIILKCVFLYLSHILKY